MTLPLIAPAILSALRCSASRSRVDDFVITYFVSGSETTFPLFVWGAARVGAPPQVNVIGTAIFVVAADRRVRQRPRPGPVRAKESAMNGHDHRRSLTVDLQQLARDHLWMHFTRMGGYRVRARSRSSSAATAAT